MANYFRQSVKATKFKPANFLMSFLHQGGEEKIFTRQRPSSCPSQPSGLLLPLLSLPVILWEKFISFYLITLYPPL